MTKSSVPAIFDRRRAGVLMHISSLPGPHGIGDLGPAAHAFVDWCVAAGLSIWQVLPLGPVGPGNSPYASASSFAGEPLFVSLDALAEDGLLSREACRVPRTSPRASPRARANSRSADLDGEAVQYAAARACKLPLLMQAFETWRTKRGHRARGYQAFLRRESAWLPGWCRFACAQRGAWKHPGFHAFVQWQFERQWQALKAHCAANGVLVLGDVPIFVPLQSADVADNPGLFRLDASGKPTVRTGVPPDCFSRTGQLWGHPHYRWSEHLRTRFAWWTARVQHALRRCDALRIDHFVGFVHAYEVPGAARTARRGAWKPAPGLQLLTALERACGTLPLVAEDLGAVTPRVVALREQFGLPGMKLVHNAFYGAASDDLPCKHPVDCVAYAGTHDNDTTLGWWKHLKAPARARFADYAGVAVSRPQSIPCAMMRIVMQSPAQTAIVAMQDALGLDGSARMNTPGRGTGQWRWRMAANALRSRDAARIRALAQVSARA
ncbi:MAG: 4-alpha-glucanotransferase [Phycisphaerae bacterium]|nr:4-alpha-glucanotransferase [Phycisphaerae bacterium]